MVDSPIQPPQMITYNVKSYGLKKPNKLIAYFLVLFVVIAGSIYLISYLNNGYLLVNTAPGNLVSAALASDTYSQPPIRLRANVGVRLHTGTYIITVNSGLISTRQIIIIHGHKTSTTSIVLASNLDQPEPVTSLSAMDLEASPIKIQFLDPNTSDIEEIDQNNVLSNLNSTVQFSSIQWANQGYGVAQALDGSLYTYSNGSLKQINIPSYIYTKPLTYSVSPNQVLYIASGGKVYLEVNGSFNEIFNNHLGTPVYLAAGLSNIAVGWVNKNSQYISVLSNSGKLIAESSTIASGFRWSPNGKMLVVAGKSYSKILGSNLNQIAIIPSYNIIDPVWLNNNTVVYASGDQVWSYDIQSMHATTIANTSNHNINGIVVDASGSYIYLSIIGAKNNSSATTVMRVGLNNQVVSLTAVELAKYLPWVSGFCLVGYTNFSAPTILIQSYVSPTPSTCSTAPDFLNQFGINTSTLGVYTSNVLAKSY